jgi:cell wall-associated NlpC family hydrolase
VASHRRPRSASLARATVLTATAAAVVALAAQAASADPKPSKDQVKSQVDDLYNQAEQATEKYDAAQEQQSTLQNQVNSLQNQAAREQEKVNTLAEQFGEFASAEYRTGGIDPSLQLFLSSNPGDYLEKATDLQQVSSAQAAAIQQMEQEKRILDQERAEAAGKLAQLDDTRKELGQQKQDIQGKLAKAQALLNSLTSQERQAIQNAGSLTNPNLGSSVAASARAAVALAAGKTRIGDAYIFGTEGPNTFDCSGFTMWAYAQAGIHLPRTSYEQANAGTHLSMGQLKPGDLVIMNGGEHVGLFAGYSGGQPTILHAPHTGSSVRYESLSDGYLSFDYGVRVG